MKKSKWTRQRGRKKMFKQFPLLKIKPGRNRRPWSPQEKANNRLAMGATQENP